MFCVTVNGKRDNDSNRTYVPKHVLMKEITQYATIYAYALTGGTGHLAQDQCARATYILYTQYGTHGYGHTQHATRHVTYTNGGNTQHNTTHKPSTPTRHTRQHIHTTQPGNWMRNFLAYWLFGMRFIVCLFSFFFAMVNLAI
jgi:hypothetical protein